MSEGWKYYNHALIPECAPHEKVDIESLNNGAIWEKMGCALFARWISDFDCGYETQWWYTILDHPFDIDKIKAKHRYYIKQGLKNFKVVPIDFKKYTERILKILNTVRTEEYRLPTVNGISEPKGNELYLGAFESDTEELVGYAILTEHPEYVEFTSLKVLPEYEKHSINAAIIYSIIERYNDRLGEMYISNGSRTINHSTAFNDYLIRMFEFRKAYCKLHIRYRWWVRPAVKILYPARGWIESKKDKNHVLQLISGVLKMEEIVRS